MRRFLYFVLLSYVALLPFERILRVLSDSREDSVLKPYRVAGMLLCLGWVVWRARRNDAPKFDVGDKTYAIIFAWGLLMAFFWHVIEGNDLDHTRAGMQLILFGFATYVVLKNIRLTGPEISRLFIVYAVSQCVAIALSQVMLDDLGGRLKGFYKNPNQIGVAGALCFVFFFHQFVFLPKARLFAQAGRLIAAVAMIVFIALSGSRGGTAATIAGTLALLLAASTRPAGSRSITKRLAAFVALLAIVSAVSFERFESAWEETDSSTRFEGEVAREGAEERWELWVSGVNVGIDHYGLGVGSMQYLSYHLDSIRSMHGQVSSSDRTLGTHSDYVDLFASYGILGLVAFLRYAWLRARSLLSAWRARVADADAHAMLPLGMGLLAATLTIMISQNSFTGGEHFLTMALVDSIAVLALPVAARAIVRRPNLTEAAWGMGRSRARARLSERL